MRRQYISARCPALGILFFLTLAGRVCGWHAFMDLEKVPPVGGNTSLRSDIELPVLFERNVASAIDGYLIGNCSIALASMKKAILVCDVSTPCGDNYDVPCNLKGRLCDLKCATSWNSAMRDINDLVGQNCTELENYINRHFPNTMDGRAPVGELEWSSLALSCESVCGEYEGFSACRGIESFRLRPPTWRESRTVAEYNAAPCQDFWVTDSHGFRFPVLTWQILHEYEAQDEGCMGSLNLVADDEHSTWACLYVEQCDLIRSHDLSCFKYSHVRGEFHWWDMNSRLDLVSDMPKSQVEASFCETRRTESYIAIVDAVTGTRLSRALLQSVTFVFSKAVAGGDGRLRSAVSGEAAKLGSDSNGYVGCGAFKLTRNTRYWLELDAGPQFYVWKGWYYTQDEDTVVFVSVYPMAMPKCSVGVTLHWCEPSPNDLDLWLFRPGATVGENAVRAYTFWHQPQWIGPNREYEVRLQRTSKGEGRTMFGPEALYMAGQLPAGTYQVLVQVFTQNPESRMEGGCATVTLYSSQNAQGLIRAETVGPKGDDGNWWHVLNIVVSEMGDGTSVVSYGVVDRMLEPGPAVSLSGAVTGMFGTEPKDSPVTGELRMLHAFRVESDGTLWCGQLVLMGIEVLSAVTSEVLSTATVRFVGESTGTFSVAQNVLVPDGRGGFTGGFYRAEGDHVLEIQANGYSTQTMQINLQKIMEPAFFQANLLPSDGQTRIVLEWGNQPADLDLIVVPRGVRAWDGTLVRWTTGFNERPQAYDPCEDAYVWWGLADVCECSALNLPCVPTCFLRGAVSNPRYTPRMSLDVDDTEHGLPDENGLVKNGPETVTMVNLLPGEYQVIINAYPPDDDAPTFESEFSVSIYLGNGLSSVRRVDTVKDQFPGGKWFLAGYISVEDVAEAAAQCTGPFSALQQVASAERPLCYTWNAVGRLLTGFDAYPLKPTVLLALEVFNAVLNEPISDIASYTTDRSPVLSSLRDAAISLADHGFQTADFGRFTGGLQYEEGPLTLQTITVPGFVSLSASVELNGCSQTDMLYRTIWMVPNDGRTRVVVRWGDRPADVDTYVVPKNVQTFANQAPTWVDDTGNPPQTWYDGEAPYLWWGLKGEEAPPLSLVSGAATITLDRDDVAHGEVDEEKGQVINGPETVTFESLFPGEYEVYVTAYSSPPEAREPVLQSDLQIDVYLGNGANDGTGSSRLVDTVEIVQPEGKWYLVGTLIVNQDTCNAAAIMQEEQAPTAYSPQQTPPVCYEWVRSGEVITTYPLAARR
mmetsp:Transcript_46885/g.111249  ORF Transcript_46885/g.111249 Transcript_46885/m.111249 type:complete len:1266 (+) Transcript_46885:264-4061(+)